MGWELHGTEQEPEANLDFPKEPERNRIEISISHREFNDLWVRNRMEPDRNRMQFFVLPKEFNDLLVWEPLGTGWNRTGTG